MATKLKLIPGSTIRWGARRFVVVDYVGLDAVIALIAIRGTAKMRPWCYLRC
jgi:hypothetical protein